MAIPEQIQTLLVRKEHLLSELNNVNKQLYKFGIHPKHENNRGKENGAYNSIINVLKEQSEPLTVTQLHKLIPDKSYFVLSQTLHRMAKEHCVRRIKFGVRNFKYTIYNI